MDAAQLRRPFLVRPPSNHCSCPTTAHAAQCRRASRWWITSGTRACSAARWTTPCAWAFAPGERAQGSVDSPQRAGGREPGGRCKPATPCLPACVLRSTAASYTPPTRARCSSKDVIEPVLKPQWWVNCQDMAAEGCAAVRDGRLEIIPREFEATWFRCVVHRDAACCSLLAALLLSAQRHNACGDTACAGHACEVPGGSLFVAPCARPQVDGEHPRLVHLAPALVGPPHPCLLCAAGG